MRLETTTRELYTFEELSDNAKEKAIEKLCDMNVDYEWHEFVYEDSIEIARLFGLDISEIHYSGFWSQGDGACFKGRYEYKKDALKAIKEYAPTDTELHDIVSRLQWAQAANFYRVTCTAKHSGHYYHSGCMTVDCENAEDCYRTVINEDEFIQALRDFADWIYKQLETEYNYLTSETAIIETIKANKYEFTKEGKLV